MRPGEHNFMPDASGDATRTPNLRALTLDAVKYPPLMPAAPSPPSATLPVARATRSGQAMLILSALYFLSRFTGLLQRTVIGALLPETATDALLHRL